MRQAKGSPLGRRRATRSRRRAWPPAVALGDGLAHPSRTRSVAAPARRSYRRFASSSRSVRIAACKVGFMGIFLVTAMIIVLTAFIIYVIVSYRIETAARNERKLKTSRFQ